MTLICKNGEDRAFEIRVNAKLVFFTWTTLGCSPHCMSASCYRDGNAIVVIQTGVNSIPVETLRLTNGLVTIAITTHKADGIGCDVSNLYCDLDNATKED